MNSILNKKMKVMSLLVLLAMTLLYQNCSKVAFSEAQDLTSSEQVWKVVYPLEQQSSSTQQFLKVLLVIDNSRSMSATQDKLKRNIYRLISELKNLNTEIRIVKTDELVSGRYHKITQTHDSVGRNIQVMQAQPRAASTFPHFKFTSVQSEAEKATILSSLEAAIDGVGVDGSGEEAPLASFAYSLIVDKYFSQGDVPLVYFITDENDSYSMEHLAKFPLRQWDFSSSMKYVNYVGMQFDPLSATRQFETVFGLQPNALGKIDEAQFFARLRSTMEEKFGARYLFAVSANVSGQNCIKSQGQSDDITFGVMKSYFPEDKMIISSLCSDADYSDLIDKVANVVTNVMANSYQLKIKTEDVISQVSLISQSGERTILRADQYLRSGSQIEFVNIDLTQFRNGSMEIALSKRP